MEVLEKALKTYISSKGVLADKLWDRLVQKLGLTKNIAFYHYVGDRMKEATKLISDRISQTSKKHGIEKYIIVDEIQYKLFVLEKHLDLLERLYLEENDAFKNFVDAVRGLEDRLAYALKKVNAEALAMELKHA